jgi:hypothetical protein
MQVFQHFAIENILARTFGMLVEFGFTLPGSHAAIERVFSIVNSLWLKEKYSLALEQ